MKLNYSLLIFIVLFIMHSCKDKTTYSISNPNTYKEYITSFTSGIISSRDNIQVGLQTPIDKWEDNQEIDENLFTITPKVKGKAYYQSNNTISFVPEERLKQGQKYLVTFHLSKLINVDKELEDFNFVVYTTPQDFSLELLDLQSTQQGLGYNLNGYITSSDWMSHSQVENILQAKVDDKKAKITIVGDPQKEQKSFSFIISEIERSSDDQKLVLSWNGKKEGIDKKGKIEELIPQKDDFYSFKVILNPDDNNQSFWINFSDPLKKNQNFDGLITLNHEATIKFSTDGNILKVFSETPFNGNKKITIHQGIENSSGNKTTKVASFDLNFDQQKPEIKFINNGTILPSSQNLKINFQAKSLKAVDVKVYKIFENNILQFLQDNELDGKYSLRKVASPIAKKTITFSNENIKTLNQWNSYAIDLSTIIDPDPGAIYRVELSFNKSYSLYNCNDSTDNFKENNIENNEEDWEEFDYDDAYYLYYYYGYNWEERENPCDKSYYYDKEIATNILATDLGVIAKKGDDNSYLFAVTNLLTTDPVNKAKIEIYTLQQQLLATIYTDKDGIAQKKIDKQGYFAIIKKDKSTTYIKLDKGNSLSVSNFDVDGQTYQKGLNGYIYTERGVWRPGDDIFLGFILDDSANELPENHPIKIDLKDPYGKIVEQQVIQKNQENHYIFTLNTDSDAPTGNWEVIIGVGGAKFYKKIKIETIKPNRLKIKNNIEGKTISSSKRQLVDYQVNWLQGSIAKGLKAEVQAKLLPQKTSFKGFEKYTFNNKLTSYFNDYTNVFSGKTDENGRFSFYLNNNETPENTGLLKLLLTTKVHEKGGDVSTDVSSATYSPYYSYVGIANPEGNKYGTLETGKENTFNFITLKENGDPETSQVKIEIYHLDWRWWWDSSNYGISNYSSSTYHTLYNTSIISTNSQGKGSYTINIPDEDWGRYEIVATNLSSGHISSEIFYIDWPIWSGKIKNNRGDEAITLSIATDKKNYVINEKAKISFPSSEGGRALISIENGSSIIETNWVKTEKGETVYELLITEAMVPNAYVHITMIQPHATTINDSPIRLYGIIPIFSENKNTKLKPIIKMPNELQPEQNYNLQVSESSGQAMTYSIAIVEEGLLDLTRFATPTPWNAFYSKAALGVKTWDIYNDVIGAYGGTINQVFSIGGDEDLGAGQVKKANRFKPVVIFKGPFNLEKGKTASHDIKLPNYIGSIRTMVIASNTKEKAYGNAEKTTTVKKPLMILGSLPRRAVTGEKVSLPVTVFAMEKQIKNVQVTVKTDDKFNLLSAKTQYLTFEEPDEKIVYFDLDVTEKTGVSKIIIEATSGKEKAVFEVEMIVMNPNPISFKEETVIIEPNSTTKTNWNTFGIPGSNKAIIEFSTFPGINLNSRLNYLINYPHGCSEQITSSAFPQLYLADFTDLSKTQKEKIQQNVSTAIQKLSKNQLNDGSFTYWNGSRYFDDWSTSYIGHFFLEAEKKGYVLPVNSLANWLKFQQKIARQWKFENRFGNDFAQAYRLYTLALAGHPDLASMNRLRETKGISNNAKLRLAAAYSLTGQKDAALKLTESTILDDDNYYYFGSYERNLAMALETHMLLGNKKMARDYALDLAKKLASNKWMSTQTTAYALRAISQYIKNNENKEGISIDYTVNGIKKNVDSQQSFVEKNIESIQNNNNVRFENKNNTTVYAKIAYSGILPVGQELVYQSGLSIKSNFKTLDGLSINPTKLTQGTEFICNISITNTTNISVENVALTQIVPSGWEIVNLRYTDAENNTNIVDHTDIRDDRTNFYFSLEAKQTKTLQVTLNASYPGHYYMPGIQAGAMYDNKYNSRTQGQWVDVVK